MRVNKTLLFSLMLSLLVCWCPTAESGRTPTKAYPPIKGTVVDSDTGKPLEGALIVAQWTKKHGFGLTYHELILITETLTDKDGKFAITKTPNDWILEPPEMIIYKEGYIPWRNDSIFPSSNIVKDHEWNNNVTYRLDVFTDKYTFRDLFRFLDSGMMGAGRKEVPIISDVMSNISIKEKNEIIKKMSK